VQCWRARYRDARCEVATTIDNDGKTLRMAVCGVHFAGDDFDALEVVSVDDPAELSRFSFASGALCA
jgi:hypothetical protein